VNILDSPIFAPGKMIGGNKDSKIKEIKESATSMPKVATRLALNLILDDFNPIISLYIAYYIIYTRTHKVNSKRAKKYVKFLTKNADKC